MTGDFSQFLDQNPPAAKTRNCILSTLRPMALTLDPRPELIIIFMTGDMHR